jgi:2-methylisocitrate lyase-like PEP mutase family enzyme
MSVRKKYREILARPSLDLVPGAYDALSARIIEAEGFPAVGAGGYAAVGSMMAQPDGGQSNVRDYADHYGRICDAVNLPVFVDADTGFGGVHNVREMVRAFEKAGVAGLFIGDQVFPNRCGYLPGKEIIPVEEFLAKLLAALDARTDEDMVIAARTDCFALEGLDAAIERCQLFMEAGADMAMPQGADTVEAVERLKAEVPGPRNYTMSHAAGKPKVSIKKIEEMGISVVNFPSAALFAAVGGVQRTVRALRDDLSFDAVDDELVALESYYDVVGLTPHNDREQHYVEGAAAMVAKKRQAAE